MSQNINHDPLDSNPDQPTIKEHGEGLRVRFIKIQYSIFFHITRPIQRKKINKKHE